MTEIYCVSCGEFVKGQETEGGEGICPKCKEQVEKIVEDEGFGFPTSESRQRRARGLETGLQGLSDNLY